MSPSSFAEHAHDITERIGTLAASGVTRLLNLQIDSRSALRGLISGILGFDNDSELHFREYIDVTQPEPRVMYAYHYQDASRSLIFRYDNAAHRPALPQAEHKHMPSGITLCPAPSLSEVIDEILDMQREE